MGQAPCDLKIYTVAAFLIFFFDVDIFMFSIEFVTIFSVLFFWLPGMWDLISPTRD